MERNIIFMENILFSNRSPFNFSKRINNSYFRN